MPMARSLAVRLGLAGTLAVTAQAQAQWAVSVLTPIGAQSCVASGVYAGQQVGQVTLSSGASHAGLWTGIAGSWVDLNPPSAAGGSSVTAVNNGQQVGSATMADFSQHAGLWSSTAASWIDLNPAGALGSVAYASKGGQQVGYVIVGFSGGVAVQHASMWSGTAASWTDLNPSGASGSVANGVDGGQQAGFVFDASGICHASLWNGSAAAWIDLDPSGSIGSSALGASGGQQVGYVQIDGITCASLWSGTAATWVNLNPTGMPFSEATGVFQLLQVGFVIDATGKHHAALWSGTSDSWIDLGAFTPSAYTDSEATGIWSDTGFTYVVGYAWNRSNNANQALLWTRPAGGVCCNGSSCLAEVTAGSCTGAHRLFVANWTACNAIRNTQMPCCKADYNKVGGVTVQDIFDFLVAWFARDPSADTNGDGAVTPQDIFDFLAAWFNGC